MNIFIIFPIHLFENIDLIKNLKPDLIYLIEHPIFFNKYPFHKIKLSYHRATMKFYYDYLSKFFKVKYIDCNDVNLKKLFLKNININLYDPINHDLLDEILSYKNTINVYNNPNFLESVEDLYEYRELNTNKVNYYHDASFYKWQRKRLNILIDKDGKPLFNSWSFDNENRKPFDKEYSKPKIDFYTNKYWLEANKYVEKNWLSNFGTLDYQCLFPLTFEQNKKHLKNFIKFKLKTFGKYEDAVSDKILFGSHSLLSTSLNVGLIEPQYIIDEIMKFFNKQKDKKKYIASVEGFIRQIIGWRSFTRFLYQFHGRDMIKMNLLNHKNKLPKSWLKTELTTGFTFIDDLIKKTEKYAYLHHIERLMYMGNLALITQIKPLEIYKWFMICFADSYEWVMVSNVMGMSQFSLKKISMMTRPYFSSSAYIKRMSDLKSSNIIINKIEYKWEDVWNALYYNFIYKHKDLLKKIYAIAMQVRNWEKLKDQEEKIKIAKLYLTNKYG